MLESKKFLDLEFKSFNLNTYSTIGFIEVMKNNDYEFETVNKIWVLK